MQVSHPPSWASPWQQNLPIYRSLEQQYCLGLGEQGCWCWWVWGSSVMRSGEHSGAYDRGLDSFSFSGLHPECHARANQHWNVPWLSDSFHAAVVKSLMDYINFSQMFMAIMFVPST